MTRISATPEGSVTEYGQSTELDATPHERDGHEGNTAKDGFTGQQSGEYALAGHKSGQHWRPEGEGTELGASATMHSQALEQRSDDFRRSLQQAGAGEGEVPAQEIEGLGSEGRESGGHERVLAACAASPWPVFPGAEQTQAPAASIARIHEAIESISGRVEQAVKAELYLHTGNGQSSLSIAMNGLVEGLDSITVRMSATGLDVVLTGSAVLAGDAVHAAQALADRLSRRFGSRNIRILEATGTDNEGGTEASATAARIARTGPGGHA